MKKLYKALLFLKTRLLYPASFYTILISIFFMLITITDFEPSITINIFLSVFAFSFTISLTNLLLCYKKIHIVFRYIIHYIVNLVAFIVFWHMCYPQSIGAHVNLQNELTGKYIWEIDSQQFVFGLCIFTFIYLILIGASLAFKAIKSTEKQPEEEYKNIF